MMSVGREAVATTRAKTIASSRGYCVNQSHCCEFGDLESAINALSPKINQFEDGKA